MIPESTRDTALVLGGGGAKGSYEIGVIEALERLNIHAGSVYGVSVGALNAALYAQHALEQADRLWSQLRLDDLVNEESLSLAEAAENLFDHPEKLVGFLSRYSKNKGIDISPYESLLRTAVDADAVRRSDVRFGLTATRVSGLTLTEKPIEEMKEGQLVDWLLASSACFPVFPVRTIDKEGYIDGGFCDNVPVSMALRAGARHVIAADIGKHRSHACYDRRPNVTYIRASHPIGGLMTFDPERTAWNRKLGYLDTLRAFGLLRGFKYAFDADDAGASSDRARAFTVALSRMEAGLRPSHAVSLGAKDRAPFFTLLEEEMGTSCGAVDYFLRACELAAETVRLDPTRVLTLDSLSAQLASLLPFEHAKTLSESLVGGHIGALFSRPQIDRGLAVTCLYLLMKKRGMDFPLASYAAGSFPREFVCALALTFLLPEA